MNKEKRIYPKGKNHSGYKHGESINGRYSRLWGIWQGMIVRTTNKNHGDYRHYGARGISVCKEWLDSCVFFEWAKSHGYNDNLQIDRIDGNGNYCPENCRFVTARENNMNRPRRFYWGIYFNGTGYFIRIGRYGKFYYGGYNKDKDVLIQLRDELVNKIESNESNPT
jgi:hypothetical protein